MRLTASRAIENVPMDTGPGSAAPICESMVHRFPIPPVRICSSALMSERSACAFKRADGVGIPSRASTLDALGRLGEPSSWCSQRKAWEAAESTVVAFCQLQKGFIFRSASVSQRRRNCGGANGCPSHIGCGGRPPREPREPNESPSLHQLMGRSFQCERRW